MDNAPQLGELILHAQQAAKELGAIKPSVSVEALGLHGCVAQVTGLDAPAAGRGRTATEATMALIEVLVERLRIRG